MTAWIALVYMASQTGLEQQDADASEENGAIALWQAIGLFERHTQAYVEHYSDSLGSYYADDPEMLLYDVQAADADEILLDYGIGLYEYYKSGSCFDLLEEYVVAASTALVPLRRDDSDNWIIDSERPDIRWSAGERRHSSLIASLGASIRFAGQAGDHETVMICLRTTMKSGDAGVELDDILVRIGAAAKYNFALGQVVHVLRDTQPSSEELDDLDAMVLDHQQHFERLPRKHGVKDFVLAKALATRVCIALEKFRLENGKLPDLLDELPVVVTLDWTKDPISKSPIGYIRLQEPDEHGRDYLVYTFGPDRQDNQALEHKSQNQVLEGDISGYDVIFNRPRFTIDE